MSEAELRSELDDVVEELNSRDFRDDDCFQYEIGSHHHGIAVDITKDGEAPHKVLGRFSKAVMCAGYVVIATNVAEDYYNGDHTRIFLGDADEYFDLEDDAPDTFVVAPFGSPPYTIERLNGDDIAKSVVNDTVVAFAPEGTEGAEEVDKYITFTVSKGDEDYDAYLDAYRND
jgi:hypothetical protein